MFGLKDVHCIPVSTLLDLYDGASRFTFKQWAGREEDPLVNFNPLKPQKSTNKREKIRQTSVQDLAPVEITQLIDDQRHSCIICTKEFQSSEQVQVHLLADHINAKLPQQSTTTAAELRTPDNRSSVDFSNQKIHKSPGKRKSVISKSGVYKRSYNFIFFPASI